MYIYIYTYLYDICRYPKRYSEVLSSHFSDTRHIREIEGVDMRVFRHKDRSDSSPEKGMNVSLPILWAVCGCYWHDLERNGEAWNLHDTSIKHRVGNLDGWIDGIDLMAWGSPIKTPYGVRVRGSLFFVKRYSQVPVKMTSFSCGRKISKLQSQTIYPKAKKILTSRTPKSSSLTLKVPSPRPAVPLKTPPNSYCKTLVWE